MNEHSKQTIGKIGEDIAVDYLIKRGFTIVGRNVHVSHKEIDIIAEGADHLIFAEVKTRRQDPTAPSPFGRPVDAVDDKKKKHIYTAADIYLLEHPTEKMPRIDVIEVFLSPVTVTTPNTPPRVLRINWFQNAFGGEVNT